VIQYLPLPVAVAKGYFKDEGLNVNVTNFQAGGSRALQALLGGTTDMVVGFYDHTVQMQVQNKEIRAVIMLNQLPGGAFVIRHDLANTVKSLADLKGKRIGITALGSSSEFQTRYFMSKVGLKEGDFTLIPVGSDVTSIAAIERKSIDALNGTDPAVTIMQKRGMVDVMLDARTVEGTNKTYGGSYPTAVLYANEAFIQKNPVTVQRAVNALARSLRFIADNSPDKIAGALPKEYAVGDSETFIEVIRNSKQIFPASGHFDTSALERAKDIVAAFNPKVGEAKIDISRTYTNRFVDAAH
jgi:NitT/TauT family transport system substrate-binding protein